LDAVASRELGDTDKLAADIELVRRLVWSGAALPGDSNVLAAYCLAQLDADAGEYDAARRQIQEIPPQAMKKAGPWVLTRLHLLNARIETQTANLDLAELHALDAARLAAQANNPGLRGDALTVLATVTRHRRPLPDTIKLHADAARNYWEAGNTIGRTSVLLNQGLAYGCVGLLSESLRALEEALQSARQLGLEDKTLRTHLALGWLAARMGRLAPARRRLLSAWRTARRLRLAREEALAFEFLAETYLLGGSLPKARLAARCCRRIVERIAPEGDIAVELGLREAMIAQASGDLKSGEAIARQTVRLARHIGLLWEHGQAQRVLGTILAWQERPRDAVRAFTAARKLFDRIGEQMEAKVVEAWLQALKPPRGKQPGPPPLDTEGSEASAEALAFWMAHPLLGPQPWQQRTTSASRADDDRKNLESSRGGGARGGSKHPTPAITTSPAPKPVWAKMGLVTRTPEVLSVLALAETYAASPLPVLIRGESGTGKDLLARGVHALSGCRGRFVRINCAASRPELFAAELLGVKRGAFTGAVADRRGLFEEARDGTLLLDEIADLNPEAQGALLDYFDTGRIRAVGETSTRSVETRIVAATWRDLAERVAAGLFRADLYARLAAVVLHLPPLRERSADLPPLIKIFWRRFSGDGEAPPYRAIFTTKTLRRLGQKPWPGNVRELKHLVERLAIYAREHGTQAARHTLLAGEVESHTGGARLPEGGKKLRRSEWDPDLLRDTLKIAGGYIPEAARLLGLSRSRAYELYRRLGSAREG